MTKRFARIAATTMAAGALLLGGGIAATAAHAETVTSSAAIGNPVGTENVKAFQSMGSPASSGHDWNDVPDPTMR